jgi:ABC-type multidrug transport system ATPase subunit
MGPSLSGPLALHGVDVHAGSFQILHGISMSLQPGELCALIGPSGAGKSTLIKVLLGLRSPSAGRATLAGGPVTAVPVGYVPQDDALHGSLRVDQTLAFAAELRLPDASESERQERIARVAEQVGLGERMGLRVRKLSGGQRKRVSVALELLTAPPVLILDEPTSGLDPGLEARMMGLFADLARQGHIVLVATHAMQSLAKCDALAVLVQGRTAWFGTPGGALDYFEVRTFAGIFEALGAHAPLVWGKAWSQKGAGLSGRPRPVIQAPAASPTPAAASPASAAEVEPTPAADTPAPAPSPLSAAEQELARLKREMGR